MTAIVFWLLLCGCSFVHCELNCDDTTDLVERAVLHNWQVLCPAAEHSSTDKCIGAERSERHFGAVGENYLEVRWRGESWKRDVRLQHVFDPIMDLSNVFAISLKMAAFVPTKNSSFQAPSPYVVLRSDAG